MIAICLQSSSKYFIAALTLLLLATSPLAAQDDGDVVHGEIEFEENIEKKVTYSDIQDGVLAKLDMLLGFIDSPKQDVASTEFAADDNSLQYLNSLYLYCSVNRGTCPSVLDTILEFDIISSRIDEKAACSNLRRFWKLWIEADMQQRHQYQVRTSYLRETENFKKKSLPKYLRCTTTVEKALAEGSELDFLEYFKQRYKNGEIQRSVLQVKKDIQALQTKEINVFFATGVKK